MSKFVDKLRLLSRGSILPMGFRTAANKPKNPAMLLIAGLTQATAKAVVDSGADAGLVSGRDIKVGSLKSLVREMGDVPLGVFVEGMSREEMSQFAGSGCDFAVLDIKAPAAMLKMEGVGKLIAVKPSLEEGLVEAIGDLELPIDGVLITAEVESFVSIERLLICQHFVELVDKPLLLTLPSVITGDELRSLQEAGVDGVVVSAERSVESLVELRKMIDDLPRAVKRRRGRPSVVLPRSSGAGGEVEEEEEEEI